MRRAYFGRSCALLFVLLLAGPDLVGGRGAARADGEDKGTPLPVDKSQTLKTEGKSYVIDGPTVIPAGIELTILRGIRVLGINNASLEVRGGLKAHGTQGVWVVFQNVDFSPTSSPNLGIHFDMVDFQSCKFKHSDAQGFDGKFQFENSTFQRTCDFDVRITGQSISIVRVEFGIPVRIRLARPGARKPDFGVGIGQSWFRDLVIVGPGVANVRNSELRKGLEVRNVLALAVDGCDSSGNISVLQGEEDTFANVTLTKTNLFDGAKLVLSRPEGPKVKPEKVKVDKFFFGPKNGVGVTSDKEVAAQIQDKADDPTQSIEAWWSKPNERQHALVNYQFRVRTPDLK
jgi:hypothetical protein